MNSLHNAFEDGKTQDNMQSYQYMYIYANKVCK